MGSTNTLLKFKEKKMADFQVTSSVSSLRISPSTNCTIEVLLSCKGISIRGFLAVFRSCIDFKGESNSSLLHDPFPPLNFAKSEKFWPCHGTSTYHFQQAGRW